MITTHFVMKTRKARLVLSIAVAILGATHVARAQDADARFAVAYVEVMPAAVGPAVDAFRRYREASRAESGFVAFELAEQIGRPGHLAVIETWKDPAALDTHQAAPSLAQFRNALQPIRISGYDQRPYKTLAAAPPRGAAPRTAVQVISHVDIGGGPQVDVPALLKQLAETSRAEQGCLRFDVLQHTMRANHFTVVEVWDSQQALDRHAAAASTRRYRDDVQPVSGSPLDERAYRRVE